MVLLEKENTRARDSIHKTPRYRKCAFKDCCEMFEIKGKTKYCPEHQDTKYRAVLYGREQGETPVFGLDGNYIHATELNTTKKHTYTYATKVVFNCECCGKPYELILYPKQFLYPKYCEEHRNEFKRNQFIRKQNEKKANDSISNPTGRNNDSGISDKKIP